MQNFRRLASGLDVVPLLNAIWGQPQLWEQIVARQLTPGSPHKDTETIYCRWADKLTVDACFNDLKAVDYPALDKLPEVRGLVEEAFLGTTIQELGRIIIVKLKPGGVIDAHVDEGAYADRYERFHLCLTSNEGSWFRSALNDNAAEFVHMQPGEFWWFNHKREHQFFNTGDTARIHMIVDCVAPKYRRERDAISA